ncbi:MAG: hypothetical protein U1F67_00020 [Rubrivivax sp.]
MMVRARHWSLVASMLAASVLAACAGRSVSAGASPPIALPIAIADLRSERYGIWPFGIHGGGHPEGHGGFDFELCAPAAIRAPLDGVIARRSDNETFAGQQDLCIEAGELRVQIGHLRDIPDQCRAGAMVKRGDLLGRPGAVNDGEFHMIHFAVQRDGSPEPYGEEGPLSTFAAADARALETFYASVPAAHKDAFEAALCNPRRLQDEDPLVGVWFPLTPNELLPRVLTLTPFVEAPHGRRALLMGKARLADRGRWQRAADGAGLVSAAVWPTMRVALDGATLVVSAGDATMRYRRDAFASLRY